MIKKFCLLAALLLSLLLSAQETKSRQVVFYFDVDADRPLQEAFKTLLPELKGAKVTRIYGHTDSTATEAYNLALSERRANHVADFLKKNGISLAGAEIKGLGEAQPSGGGLITDRRVVLYYETVPAVTNTLSAQVSGAKKGDKLKLKNLNFENNSDVVLPSSRPVLNELLKIMQENPSLKIDIQGHICCEPVDATYVSRLRALAVYNFLIKSGIDRSRLSYQSFGSSRPIYPLPEKTEEEKVANRRVEIEILEN